LLVIENLLVDITEMLPLSEVIEIHLVDLVDDLAQELAGIFFVLAFQDVTSRTKSEHKNLLASASAMQRPLHTCLERTKLQGPFPN
jgi:hypothetical protein